MLGMLVPTSSERKLPWNLSSLLSLGQDPGKFCASAMFSDRQFPHFLIILLYFIYCLFFFIYFFGQRLSSLSLSSLCALVARQLSRPGASQSLLQMNPFTPRSQDLLLNLICPNAQVPWIAV